FAFDHYIRIIYQRSGIAVIRGRGHTCLELQAKVHFIKTIGITRHRIGKHDLIECHTGVEYAKELNASVTHRGHSYRELITGIVQEGEFTHPEISPVGDIKTEGVDGGIEQEGGRASRIGLIPDKLNAICGNGSTK